MQQKTKSVKKTNSPDTSIDFGSRKRLVKTKHTHLIHETIFEAENDKWKQNRLNCIHIVLIQDQQDFYAKWELVDPQQDIWYGNDWTVLEPTPSKWNGMSRHGRTNSRTSNTRQRADDLTATTICRISY